MTRETALEMVADMWAAAEKRMLPQPASGHLFWIAQGVAMGVTVGVLGVYELAKPFWGEMYSLHQDLRQEFLGRYEK